jgi:glycosyltransferase involved in cell wall biosynthesis
MKIALIDPALFTWPYDSALAAGLVGNGHEVTLYTKRLSAGEQGKGSPLVREVFYPGFQYAFMRRLPRSLFLALKGLAHPLSLLRLYFILARQRPDVIHFQWAPLPVIDRLFIPLFRRLAPVVLTVHDSSPFNNNPSGRLQRVGCFTVMQEFDRLIVHTEKAKEKIASHGIEASRIAIIAHGVLGEAQPQTVTRPVAKSADQPVTVLLFGKLKPYKGADILIRALAVLPEAVRANIRLHIVGKSEMDTAPLFELADSLKVSALIKWDLRFVDDAEMAGIFANADIMALPYRDIDASGVLMVALSVGRPIVASRIGLFAEILKDGVHGYLIPQEDPAALAEALTKLATNPDLRRQMSAEVHNLGNATPSWTDIGATTTALYQQVKGGKS